MKPIHSILATLVLAVLAAMAFNSTQANDEENRNPTSGKAGNSGQFELIERIEALEKRIAKLEAEQPLIRQADSRELTGVEPGQLPDKRPTFLPRTPLRPMPEPESTDDDVRTEKSKIHRENGGIYMHYIVPSDGRRRSVIGR